MAQVILKHVDKIYPGNVFAVKDANLEINDQEFVVLVGPSGCGKSTTLRMVAGLEEISNGTVSIDGRVVNDVPPKDRDIAMVFQNYALYPHMNVRENMAFGLKLRKFEKSEIAERVDEAAEILELTPLMDRKPKALSGGQRQRVALGRAIVRKPKVFLFDEPLSNLDAKLRHQMRAEILKLHRKLSATIIYVTHDQVEAMTMGTRIVVMKDGRVQQVDSPIDVYHKPSNQFVAGFIGSPTMNFIHGTITDGVFNGRSLNCELPEALKNLASNGPMTIGIRPEDLQLNGNGGSGTAEGEVELAETMGSEIYLHMRDNDTHLIAKVPPSAQFEIGARTKLTFNPDAIHLFDPNTGVTIR